MSIASNDQLLLEKHSTLNQGLVFACDPRVVLANARMLQRAAYDGTTQPVLKGKHIGLMSPVADGADAVLFRSAVMELGGQVAHIPPSLTELSRLDDVEHTAKLLGRLYDGVECHGVPEDILRRMNRSAGIPIFDAISSRHHPLAHLACLLDASTSPTDNRRFVLQAILLSALA